jgi:hypothetical protein
MQRRINFNRIALFEQKLIHNNIISTIFIYLFIYLFSLLIYCRQKTDIKLHIIKYKKQMCAKERKQ